MSSNKKVICCLCETTVKKNLETYPSRRHPGDDLKWKSASSNDVRIFFSGNPKKEKRKSFEIDATGDISEAANVENKRSRLEDTSEISDVDYSIKDGDLSTNLEELLEAVKGKTKFFFLLFFLIYIFYFQFIR